MGSVVSRFAPPLLLMAAIFWFSAQPDLGTGLGDWDLLVRKLAHMAEFGLLWALWGRALGYGSPLPAALIAVAYAATDEYHQTFTDGRVGSPVDVLIDTAGVAAAILVAKRRSRRYSQPRSVA